jgi:hypothetical protein
MHMMWQMTWHFADVAKPTVPYMWAIRVHTLAGVYMWALGCTHLWVRALVLCTLNRNPQMKVLFIT